MTHLEILQALRAENRLTAVEKNLMDINMTFLNSDLPILKKSGNEGINSLINQVNFRLGIVNLLSQHVVGINAGAYIVKRW